MKKNKIRNLIIISVILAIIFGSEIKCYSKSERKILKVATHNIHGRNYLDVEKFKEFIDEEGVNCIGMQEVDYESKLLEQFYINDLKNKVSYQSENSNNNNMILSEFKLYNDSKISLPSENEERFFVKAELNFNDKTISVYTTHFSYHEVEERVLQYEKLKEMLMEDGNEYKIIMGDFNAAHNSDYENLKDILDSVQGWNGLWYDTNDDDSYKSIDNIFISKNIKITNVACVEDKFGSDHRMLIADLLIE